VGKKVNLREDFRCLANEGDPKKHLVKKHVGLGAKNTKEWSLKINEETKFASAYSGTTDWVTKKEGKSARFPYSKSFTPEKKKEGSSTVTKKLVADFQPERGGGSEKGGGVAFIQQGKRTTCSFFFSSDLMGADYPGRQAATHLVPGGGTWEGGLDFAT